MSNQTMHTSTVPFVQEEGEDDGHFIMRLFVKELKRRLSTPEVAQEMTAAEMTVILRLLSDNSISMGAIRKGDFGETAQRVAEEFPFPSGSMVQ